MYLITSYFCSKGRGIDTLASSPHFHSRWTPKVMSQGSTRCIASLITRLPQGRVSFLTYQLGFQQLSIERYLTFWLYLEVSGQSIHSLVVFFFSNPYRCWSDLYFSSIKMWTDQSSLLYFCLWTFCALFLFLFLFCICTPFINLNACLHSLYSNFIHLCSYYTHLVFSIIAY